MTRSTLHWAITATTAFAGSTSGYSVEYLTVSQAQQAIFPGASFTPNALRLTETQRRAIEKKSGVWVRTLDVHAWRADPGGWFLVDEVLGKHEFITYACGIDAAGHVIAIEILAYRETYGDEIRRNAWRAQFSGKTASDPLTLDSDIRNISGATLSCRHVTDGVKRLLATHALILKG